MRCIVGIGNPGSRYTFNRHNVGFQLLDYFSINQKKNFKPANSDYYYAVGEIHKNPFILVKPATFVNNSGIAVADCLSKYEIDSKDCLIVVDDINLNFGEFRMRKTGGDGGHNGLESIIYNLNSTDFPRIRVGIGSEFEKGQLSDYVLSDFNKEEQVKLIELSKTLNYYFESFITGGYDLMLKKFSQQSNFISEKKQQSQPNGN